MSKENSNIRWRYFIKKHLQMKYAMWVGLFIMLVVSLIGVDVYLTVSKSYSEVMNVDITVYETLKSMNNIFFLKAFVYLVVIIFISVYVSNKIAGPIFNLERLCGIIEKGNIGQELRLRKGDELTDLQDKFNSMLRSIQNKVSTDRETARSVSGEITTGIETLKKSGLSTDKKDELVKMLDGLKSKIDSLTSQFKL